MHLLSATAIALGHKVEDLILNRSSLMKYRKNNRKEIANEIQSSYHVRTSSFFYFITTYYSIIYVCNY